MTEQTPSAPSEAGLVDRARAGDAGAAAELYRLHQGRVFNLALRMTGNSWDAADLTQEAFIKAFAGLPNFRGEAGFGTWVHRIAVNTVYDFLRRPRPVLDPRGDLGELAEHEDVSSATDPLRPGRLPGNDPFEAGESLSAPVRKALLRLDEPFRFAVVLCDLLGFSYADAAQLLDVREGTVKSRIFRARALLSEWLGAEGYGPAVVTAQGTSEQSASSEEEPE